MAELVSVVMPNFNGARFIGPAMRSALDQSHGELELIVVDDGSTDDSRDIIAQLERQDQRVRAFYETERQGPAVARNRAIAAARGRYVAFLDSDDLWEAQKLSTQVALHERAGCVLSYTGYRKIDETGRALGDPLPMPARVTYGDLLRTCPIYCSTAMYDTRKAGKVRMPDIFRRQDYALWLELLRGGGAAIGCKECLTRYRVHPTSLSANKIVAARYQWRVLRELEHQALGPAVYYFTTYALRGMVKFMR
jgi:teichuronic acid biosynthesis glycosyltransferase TuaG